MPRVFFGVEIPPEVKKRLLKLKSPFNGARWQSRNQLHMTLVFIGSVNDDDLETLSYAASLVSAPAFEVDVTGLGAFGRPEHPPEPMGRHQAGGAGGGAVSAACGADSGCRF